MTLGLGSCIGLVLYDQTGKGRLYGAYLRCPSAGALERKQRKNREIRRYGGAGVDQCGVCAKGALRTRLKAKLLPEVRRCLPFRAPRRDFLAVGSRNAKETVDLLKKTGIPLVNSDVGGNKGRTVEFSTVTWMLTVKVLGKGKTEI